MFIYPQADHPHPVGGDATGPALPWSRDILDRSLAAASTREFVRQSRDAEGALSSRFGPRDVNSPALASVLRVFIPANRCTIAPALTLLLANIARYNGIMCRRLEVSARQGSTAGIIEPSRSSFRLILKK